MAKFLISVIVAAGIIVCGAVWENINLQKTFGEMITAIDEVTGKIYDDRAVEDDIRALKNLWIKKKESLHAYVPHTEIKEIDLWISECVANMRFGKKEEAVAKLEVVRDLCVQIPKTFSLKIENLF